MAEDDDLKATYERAHELYLAFRHEIAVAMEDSEEHIEGTSAGGMPVRIKCLHALLAQTLVMARAPIRSETWHWRRFVMNSTPMYAVARWKTKTEPYSDRKKKQ